MEKRSGETAALHTPAGPGTTASEGGHAQSARRTLTLWGSHAQGDRSIWVPRCSLLDVSNKLALGKASKDPVGCSDVTSPPEVNAEQSPGQHSPRELQHCAGGLRWRRQEQEWSSIAHLGHPTLPPQQHERICLLQSVRGSMTMMEMCAIFILLSGQEEERMWQGASARWKTASFSKKWRPARGSSWSFSHLHYLNRFAMVLSPNLPRPSWVFSLLKALC